MSRINWVRRVMTGIIMLPTIWIFLWASRLTSLFLFVVLSLLLIREYIPLRSAALRNLLSIPPEPDDIVAAIGLSLISVSLHCLSAFGVADLGLWTLLFCASIVGSVALAVPIMDIFIPLRHSVKIVPADSKGKDQNSASPRLQQALISVCLDSFFVVVWLAGFAAGSKLRFLNTSAFGFSALFYPLVLAWVSDTFALIVGSAFGNTKLFPEVSPNKTVKGFFGSFLGPPVVGLVYLIAFNLPFFTWADVLTILNFWQLMSCGFVCCFVGAIGDYLQSCFKRVANQKDAGDLFGAHGGLFDKVDSTFPSFYVMLFCTLAMQPKSHW